VDIGQVETFVVLQEGLARDEGDLHLNLPQYEESKWPRIGGLNQRFLRVSDHSKLISMIIRKNRCIGALAVK
jgi:hypothetical protein